MAHDLLKIGLTLAFMAVVVISMALLVSGLLSAYKPGEKGMQGQTPAVTGGKSIGAAVPSPTIPVNATMTQYARYMPPGPMIPEPVQPAWAPPMPMEGGMQPPPGWPGPSTAVAPAMPIMPSAPGISSIIEILFRLLPLIFHHQFDLTPIWPQLSR